MLYHPYSEMRMYGAVYETLFWGNCTPSTVSPRDPSACLQQVASWQEVKLCKELACSSITPTLHVLSVCTSQ